MTMSLLPTPARIPTGVTGLDTILQGGLLQGGIYIIMGPPGTGKTILSNQICFQHVVAGGRVVYVTLLAELHTRMLTHLASLTFFDSTPIGDALYYISGYHTMEQTGLDGLLAMLRAVVRDHRATLLVIDGLASAQTVAESDLAFERFIQQVHAFVDVVGCTCLLITTRDEARAHPEHTVVDGLIDLTNQRVGLRTVRALEILKFRGTNYLPGQHNLQITDAGLVVYPRTEALFASDHVVAAASRQRMGFDIPHLDHMLHGGLLSSSTTMLIGPPGTGKTLLGLQFLAAGARQDQVGLHFSFYETPTRIQEKAAQVGLDFHGYAARGLIDIIWQSPLEEILDALADRLLSAIQRRNVQRLFLDGLNGFHAAAVDQERLSRFFTALTHELRRVGVTTIFSVESRDLFHAELEVPIQDLSAIVENIMFLRYAELRSQIFRIISILKVRESGYTADLREFTISDEGLVVAATSESVEAILLGASQAPLLGPVPAVAPRSGSRRRGR